MTCAQHTPTPCQVRETHAAAGIRPLLPLASPGPVPEAASILVKAAARRSGRVPRCAERMAPPIEPGGVNGRILAPCALKCEEGQIRARTRLVNSRVLAYDTTKRHRVTTAFRVLVPRSAETRRAFGVPRSCCGGGASSRPACVHFMN